jgi:hypothetical protein
VLFKFVIIALLIGVLASLTSALVFLYKDPNSSKRIVKALTWRIVLSIVTIALLVLGLYKGWIVPHPLMP